MGIPFGEEIMIVDRSTWTQFTSVTDGQTDGRTDRQNYDNSWARTRGAHLSARYTVNTYSKPPLYDASKGNDVWFSQRVALGKPDVSQQAALFQ